MECSDKTGGDMWFHWTHENGTSVDFMVPTKNGNTKTRLSDYAGLVHYLFKFNEDGKFSLNHHTEIDFDAIANHLMAIDDAAKTHGLRIRKILFNTELQDNLFATPAGQKLLARDLNFIPHLNDLVNMFHDDHYHVDFELAP
jgi:penicillin-insensitive murein endopeptidase